MQEPQHLQVAQSRGRRGPYTAVRIRQDLVWSFPTLQRQHRELSPAGCSQCQQDLDQRGGSMGTQPQGTLLSLGPWLAGSPAAMPAAMHLSPAWKGQQGSLAGVELIHPYPAMTGGCKKKPKWDHYAHTLFILDGSGQGSEFVLFVFISFPHNAEKSQHRDKSCQNGRVFTKPLSESPLE